MTSTCDRSYIYDYMTFVVDDEGAVVSISFPNATNDEAYAEELIACYTELLQDERFSCLPGEVSIYPEIGSE